MSEHTPTPWHASDRGIGWEVHFGAEPREGCWSGGSECRGTNDGHRGTMSEANAAHIVRCVNAFDALLAVLEGLSVAELSYRRCHDVHGDGSERAGYAWDQLRQAGDRARAAIQQAGEKK